MTRKIIKIIIISCMTYNAYASWINKIFPKPQKSSMRKGLQEAQIKRIINEVSEKFKWKNNQKPKFTIETSKNSGPAAIDPATRTLQINNDFYKDTPRKQFRFVIAHEIAHQQQYNEHPILHSMVYNASNPIGIRNLEYDADMRAAFALNDASDAIDFFSEAAKTDSGLNIKNKFLKKTITSMLEIYATHPTHADRKQRLIEIQKIINEAKK